MKSRIIWWKTALSAGSRVSLFNLSMTSGAKELSLKHPTTEQNMIFIFNLFLVFLKIIHINVVNVNIRKTDTNM